MRTIVDIEIVSADQLTYGEYILSLPASTALFLFEMKPLEGNGVLEMNPSLVLMMVERLFGGSGGGAGISRDLTTHRDGGGDQAGAAGARRFSAIPGNG